MAAGTAVRQSSDPEAAPALSASDADGTTLREPLLATRPAASPFRYEEGHAPKSNFWDCVFNLCKVILGAGIMALPKAVALLGWGAGLALLLAVGVLTHFTVHGLIVGSDRTQRDTYSGLVRASLGAVAEKVLQATLLLGCLGFEVVYIDIIGDLLVGEEPDLDGLVTTWLPPEQRHAWWLGRPLVLAALVVCVLGPLASKRSMGGLGIINVLGLLCLLGFAGATVGLGAAAVARGVAHALPAGPDWEGLGRTRLERLTGILSVVPVLLTAASCHQSVHPLRAMLVPYSAAALDRVVALSLTFVTLLFVVVSGAAYTAFGRDVRGNFLNNLSVGAMSPLIGPTAATVVCYGVKGGYALSLGVSTVLIMFPLRQAALELLVPSFTAPGAPPASTPLYLGTTWGLLATAYGIAVFVPSIWTVISFVGAIACTVMCFVLPGLVLLRTKDGPSAAHRLQRAAAWGVAGLGVALFANVFVGMWAASGAEAAGGSPPPPAAAGFPAWS